MAQDGSRRNSTRVREKATPVGRKHGIKLGWLRAHFDSALRETGHELTRRQPHVDALVPSRRTSTDEREVYSSWSVHGTQVLRCRDGRRNEREQHRSDYGPIRRQALRDQRTAALDKRRIRRAQPLQSTLRDQFVAPGCRNDRVVSGGETSVRQLDRRSWRRGEHDVRAEDEQRGNRHVGLSAREAP